MIEFSKVVVFFDLVVCGIDIRNMQIKEFYFKNGGGKWLVVYIFDYMEYLRRNVKIIVLKKVVNEL